MVKKSVVDYVRGLLQKGYDTSLIRDVMLKYGYTKKDFNEAMNAIYHPTIRHEIHLSAVTVFVIIFIVVLLSGVALFIYYPPKAPTKLLDLNLEPVKTAAKPGEDIVFLKELSNLGSLKRYDVVIKQEIIDLKTFKVIAQKIETRGIETFGSTQTRIEIPKNTTIGDYILRVTVDDKKAIATLPIKVIEADIAETCFDRIKNQNEEDVDCGGVCKPCEEQIAECDDNNRCTDDIIQNGKCINNLIKPCCGNNVCEENEFCAEDCQKTDEESSYVSTETLDEIKELAKSNPSKALQQCNQIDVPNLKDECISNIGEVQRNKNYCKQIADERIRDICYSNVAKAVNDNSICEDISADVRKDSCYMTFVLDNKDYSVCDRITNKYLRDACESLRQLNEINQQQSKNQ